MSIDFDDVIKRMDAAPALSLVAPVRITAPGEDGTVFYGYGGLVYEPPDPAFVYVDAGDILLTHDDSYEFEGGRLTTEGVMTNGRVKLLNNQAYDPASPDNLDASQLPVLPHHTIGVSGDPDRLGIQERGPDASSYHPSRDSRIVAAARGRGYRAG
jgi:hypothetical protein